jgi:DNA-binding beta-propeller fold protein YncE
MKIRIVPLFIGALMMTMLIGIGFAALPAPNWMPGSPILAGNQVVVLFTPVPGAVKYVIYLNGKKVTETASIQAIIVVPDEAGKHEIQIAAVDAQGKEGAKSRPGTVSIVKLTPPEGLNSRMLGNNVGMFWVPVKGTILYNVFRSTNKDKGYQLLDSVQDVRWTDTKAEAGKKYYYKVSAKDASGKESGLSAPMAVSTVVPVTAKAEIRNVTGLKTKTLFEISDKELSLKGPVKLDEPYDIELSPDRKTAYVSAVNSRAVTMISLPDGEYLGKFGDGDPKKDGNFLLVNGLGIKKDGTVYAADPGKNRVLVFTGDGKFIKVFLKVGKLHWMKKDPRIKDVAIDEKGNVYVLDYVNAAVLTYDAAGKLKKHFALFGTKPGQTGYLTYIKVAGGAIYLADGARGRVIKVDSGGKILSEAGTREQKVGGFQFMSGFDLGPNGLVYIADRGTNLIQVYNIDSSEYQYTLANEDNTQPASLFTPKSVAVDPQTKNIYAAQGMVNMVSGLQMFGAPEVAKGK